MESFIRVADGFISAQDVLAYAWFEGQGEPARNDYLAARRRLSRWLKRGDDDGWAACLHEIHFASHGLPSSTFRAEDTETFILQVHKYMEYRGTADFKTRVTSRIKEAVDALLSPSPPPSPLPQPFSVCQASPSAAPPLPPSLSSSETAEDEGEAIDQDEDEASDSGDDSNDPELVASDVDEPVPLMDRSELRPRKAYRSYQEWVDHLGLIYGVDAKTAFSEDIWNNPKLNKGPGFFYTEAKRTNTDPNPKQTVDKSKRRRVNPQNCDTVISSLNSSKSNSTK